MDFVFEKFFKDLFVSLKVIQGEGEGREKERSSLLDNEEEVEELGPSYIAGGTAKECTSSGK